jgi:CheY-like chemotaxis protein
MARAYLEMAGHRVREAGSAADAIRLIAKRRYDAVFVGSDLPGLGTEGGAGELLAHIRATPMHNGVPVIALAGEAQSQAREGAGYDAWQSGLDRDSMLESLEKLAGSVCAIGTAERGLARPSQS